MRSTAIGFSLLTIIAGELHADMAEGAWSVSCVLKEQSAIAMQDGRAQKFGILDSDFQTGSEVYVKISFQPLQREICWGTLIVNIENFGGKPLFSAPFGPPCRKTEYLFRNDYSITGHDSLIRSDEISFSNGTGTFELSRYYRGDWQGFSFSTFNTTSGHYVGKFASYDCRAADAVFSEIYEFFENRLD